LLKYGYAYFCLHLHVVLQSELSWQQRASKQYAILWSKRSKFALEDSNLPASHSCCCQSQSYCLLGDVNCSAGCRWRSRPAAKTTSMLVRIRPHFWGVSTLKHYQSLSRPPKGTSLHETASYEPLHVKIGSVVFAVGDVKKKRKGKVQKVTSCYISRNRREPPYERILTKFRTSRDMADVIICVKFRFEKLSG